MTVLTLTHDIGRQIRFYSAWIGVVMNLCLLFLLKPTCNKLMTKYREHRDTIKQQKIQRRASVSECTYDNDSQQSKQSVLLLSLTYCSVISILFVFILMAIFLAYPERFGIQMSDIGCYIIWRLYIILYAFGMYFYFIFMLIRIRVTFTYPISLKFNTVAYICYLTLIHINLLYKLIGTQIIQTRAIVRYSNVVKMCANEVIRSKNIDALITYYFISTIIDCFMHFSLFAIFANKLRQLTTQNEKINGFIKKTVLLGIIASITSLLISIGFIFGISTEYFLNIDLMINSLCIVFSYRIKFCFCNYFNLSNHMRVIQESEIDKSSVELAPQTLDSTKSPEDEVFDLLCKSNERTKWETNAELDEKKNIIE
eukprot:528394_1